MGLFDFLKPKPKLELTEAQKPGDGFETFLVDDLFYIIAPYMFYFEEGDRFRLATESDKLHISITNHIVEIDTKGLVITKEDLERNVMPFYQDFIDNGGYVSCDDLKLTDKYIALSFSVGENETQYWLTTLNMINGKLIHSKIMLRDYDEYSETMRGVVVRIANSIRPK